MSEPIMRLKNIKKHFGTVIALDGVSFDLNAGECHCLLGDNGAGKSTFIKVMSGVHSQTEGSLHFEGKQVRFNSPNDAIKHGIATVYQDLGLIPLMSVARNFFMGHEPQKRWLGLKVFDLDKANDLTVSEMAKMGIDLRSPEQAVGTLSGGERQTIAIARAVYFGAKVLILDEPTSALGVRQTSNVLATINKVRKAGVAVVFISHNIRHALAVGDRFTVLNHGKTLGTAVKNEITPEELQNMMAGGQKLAELEDSLDGTI
jgi:simple sugar transport system ATP-binding protein